MADEAEIRSFLIEMPDDAIADQQRRIASPASGGGATDPRFAVGGGGIHLCAESS